MALIEFKNLPDTSTPINAENLNHNFNGLKIESGSNENGSYVKFPDGTLEINQRFETTISTTTAWGNLYYGYPAIGTKPYPVPFVGNKPTVTANVISKSNYFIGTVLVGEAEASLTMPPKVAGFRPTTSENITVRVHLTAKGKWK